MITQILSEALEIQQLMVIYKNMMINLRSNTVRGFKKKYYWENK